MTERTQPLALEKPEGENLLDFVYRGQQLHLLIKRNSPSASGEKGVRISVSDDQRTRELGFFTGTLETEKDGKTRYEAVGIGNKTYGSVDDHIPGLMGECIAQLVGKRIVNQWISSTNLNEGSKKMYEALLSRSKEPGSNFIVRKSWPLPLRPVQYRVYSK